MAYIDFPTSPTNGEVYSFGGRSWIFNGKAWQLITVVPQGAVGYTGSRGETGYVGSASIVPGPLGYTGSRGAGYTGSQGEIGPTGYTGSLGYTGSQGAGFTGSQGVQGYTGSRGGAGATGFTGSRGDAGIQGNVGYTGSRGVDGLIGRDGYTGSIGYTGSQGIPGITGYTGSASTVQGPIGYTGSAGAGYTGSQGEIGYTGSAGATTLVVSTILGTDLGTIADVNNGVSTLRFDTDAGFDLTNLGDGSIKVGMNSTFKYIIVDGQPMLTAVGLDTLQLIAGDNVSLVTDNTTTPQSITINATSSGGASVTVGITPPASPAAGDLWWNSETGTLKINYVDGDSAQWVDATPVSSGPIGYTGSAGLGFSEYSGTTVYVNGTTGNDTTADGSEALPFKTITAALAYTGRFVWNIAPVIQIADGTYNVSSLSLPTIKTKDGSTKMPIMRGNVTNKDAVTVNATGGPAFSNNQPGWWKLEYMNLIGSSSCVSASYGGSIVLANVSVGTTTGASDWWSGTILRANAGGIIRFEGPIYITNTTTFSVFTAYNNGTIECHTPMTVTMVSPLTVNVFVNAQMCSVADLPNVSYSGTVTGSKYSVAYNSVMALWGKVVPGTVAGTTSFGGQVAV